jgi:GNAT superfamily N-acetyltransferase
MNESAIVRPVGAADFEQWLPLWDAYNAFYGRAGPTALDPFITRTTWSRFFDPDEPMHALVAEASGRLLGLVHYLFHRSTTQTGPTCYLEDLFTVQEARSMGIGRSLIEGVYARAAAAGSPNVYWLTHQTNTVAMRLYDAVAVRPGFVLYSKTL